MDILLRGLALNDIETAWLAHRHRLADLKLAAMRFKILEALFRELASPLYIRVAFFLFYLTY